MSLHTQLVRGMVVLPALLLLAVAGLTAPAPRAHPLAPGTTAIAVGDDGTVVVVHHASR